MNRWLIRINPSPCRYRSAVLVLPLPLIDPLLLLLPMLSTVVVVAVTVAVDQSTTVVAGAGGVKRIKRFGMLLHVTIDADDPRSTSVNSFFINSLPLS